MNLSELRDLIDVDRNLGATYPERPLRPLPHKGARGHALDRFADFISLLVFRRTITDAETQAFKVPRDRIFPTPPDQSQEDQKLTGVGFIPGPYSYDEKWVYSLGRPEADEDTIDRYGPGTVLLTTGYYVEQMTVEAISSTPEVTRGIIEGIRYATRYFTDSGQLCLRCPAYFDQGACFSIVSGDGYSVDFGAAAAGRRIAHLRVEVWVPEVALIDYRRLRVLLDFGPREANVRDGNVYHTLG
jgi:hypothetical protein